MYFQCILFLKIRRALAVHTSTEQISDILPAGFLYLLIAVEQRSLFQFGYYAWVPVSPQIVCSYFVEASVSILLLCRGH
jgi:hypothetical protein